MPDSVTQVLKSGPPGLRAARRFAVHGGGVSADSPAIAARRAALVAQSRLAPRRRDCAPARPVAGGSSAEADDPVDVGVDRPRLAVAAAELVGV
jgi:hypothetical protein